MRSRGANGVGRFSVEFEVADYLDLVKSEEGTLPPSEVRRETISRVVDPGASKLVLPEAVVKRLGLLLGANIKVTYADGRQSQGRETKGVHVELLGRSDTFSAIVEPKRRTVLIGAIVLEDLDLLVDCSRQQLVPCDPSGPVYEIE